MWFFKRPNRAIQVLVNGQEILVAGSNTNMCIVAEVQLDFVTKCSTFAGTDAQEALCKYRVFGFTKAAASNDGEDTYTWQGFYPIQFDDEIIFRLISTTDISPFSIGLSSDVYEERIKECLIPPNKVSGLEVTIDNERKVSTNGEKAEALMASLYLETSGASKRQEATFLLSGGNQDQALLWSGEDGDPVTEEVKIRMIQSL